MFVYKFFILITIIQECRDTDEKVETQKSKYFIHVTSMTESRVEPRFKPGVEAQCTARG